MESWYELAIMELRSSLDLDDKVNGLDFLVDFILKNRDTFFENLEFEDVDSFASDQFDAFEIFLKSQEDIKILPNGKWCLASNLTQESYVTFQEGLSEDLSLTDSEKELLHMNIIFLTSDLVDEFRKLYSKLDSTNNEELKFKCAFRLAECGELSREVIDKELIIFWKNASDSASKINFFMKASECMTKSAYHCLRASENKKAAEYFKLAFELIENEDHEEKMELLRNSRIQYQLVGDHDSAIKMFLKEKEIEFRSSDLSKKIPLFLYKITSDYGESPKKVLRNCLFVLLIFTLLSFFMGVTVAENESLITWSALADSAYYSVITFTTLGYGDITPHGYWGKALASALAILGVFYTSLFMVSVVRRYSRS